MRFFAILAKIIKVAIILYCRYNCHLLNNRATEWHSMPLYIYFCHRVIIPCHLLPRWQISIPRYVYFCHLFKWWQNFCGPFGPLAPCGMTNAARGLCLHRLSPYIKKSPLLRELLFYYFAILNFINLLNK